MPQFIFAYHGGGMPETEEESAKVMAKWGAWMQGLGKATVNPGAPVGMSHTVDASGVAENGGANPLSGFTIVEAGGMDAATAMAKGCPILENGGTVEVAEMMEM